MTGDKVRVRRVYDQPERAAAAGPIIRLNISSAPTMGTVMDVARAITIRK